MLVDVERIDSNGRYSPAAVEATRALQVENVRSVRTASHWQ